MTTRLFPILMSLIKDILHLIPKQATYNRYKALVTQVNQCYWEDQSKNMAPQTLWNTSSNTNWQVMATNDNQPSISVNPANSAPHFPLGQGPSSTNQSPGQCPPAQLNATNLHKALEPLDTSPDNLKDAPDSTNDKEALYTNKIWDRPWINIPEEIEGK
ncbi:hypothetical protein E4T56_gene943 [Termitomyces sp. T112]|nr:hypothetical protein E4T56_gene943 [Termitomyces sp. T112]